MSLGEVNKGLVAVLIALVVGAAGYLWYSMMYKPAVAERVTAQATLDTAKQGLTSAETELAAAQQRVEQAKRDAAKPDAAVAKLALAQGAIPTDASVGEAVVVLNSLAQRSGVRTLISASEGTDTSAAGGTGATPIDIPIEAVGTYTQMRDFMDQLHGTVYDKRGKLYQNGRLFNVVSLVIGEQEEDAAQASFGLGDQSAEESGEELVPAKGEIKFELIVRMYTASTDVTGAAGEATPDAAAGAAIDPAAGTAPAAAGGVPDASGAIPGSTDPAAAGGTPLSGAPGAPGAPGAAVPAPTDGTIPAGEA